MGYLLDRNSLKFHGIAAYPFWPAIIWSGSTTIRLFVAAFRRCVARFSAWLLAFKPTDTTLECSWQSNSDTYASGGERVSFLIASVELF